MIKSELVQRILTANPRLYKRDVEKIVNVVLNEITGALSRGGRVEVRGFGAFSVRTRRARIGRNPRTGRRGAGEGEDCAGLQAGKGIAPTAQQRRLVARGRRLVPKTQCYAERLTPMASIASSQSFSGSRSPDFARAIIRSAMTFRTTLDGSPLSCSSRITLSNAFPIALTCSASKLAPLDVSSLPQPLFQPQRV